MKILLALLLFVTIASLIIAQPSFQKINHTPQQYNVLNVYRPTQITSDTLRYTFTYDSLGNCLTDTREIRWGGAWVNLSQYTYTYNSSGKPLSYILQVWSDNTWTNSLRVSYTYDSFGNLIRYYEEHWFGSWTDYWKSIYTYDNSGNKLTEIILLWENHSWSNYWNYTYTYDNSGNLLSTVEKVWEDNAWINHQRTTNTYNNNYLFNSTRETWEYDQWQPSVRYTYTYSYSGSLLICLEEQGVNGVFVNASRYTYTYDGSGNILNKLQENWQNEAWVNIFNYNYLCNTNGNAVHGESFWWNYGSWTSYPNNFSVYYNNNQNHIVITGKYFDAVYQTFTGIKEDMLKPVTFSLEQNYPNPFNPSTTINYTVAEEGHVKLSIYDLLGSELSVVVNEYKPQGSYSIQFNCSSLTSGIYMYVLQSGDKRIARKFILLK